MGYKVNYKGLEVFVDSIEELDELAERARTNSARPIVTARTSGRHGPIRISDFVAELGEIPKRGLAAILDHGGVIRDAELRRILDVENNLVLAGRFVSPIRRIANRAGIDSEQFLQKETGQNRRSGEQTIQYAVPPEAQEEVRKGLTM